jgi:hypothetical protein
MSPESSHLDKIRERPRVHAHGIVVDRGEAGMSFDIVPKGDER